MARKRKSYPLADKPLSRVSDAAVAYSNLNIVLGEEKGLSAVIEDDIDLIKLSRTGVKTSSLKYLAAYMGVSMETLSGLLHSSYRNIQRKGDSDLLDPHKSEKVLELGSLVTRGVQAVGGEAAFRDWLQSPLLALGNAKPLEFLDTSFGIQLVLDVLGRLETGVYS